MKEIRCGACGRKLGEGIFIELQIKCARCKTMNHLRVKHPEPAHHECRTNEAPREKIPNRKPEPVSG